MMPDDGRPTELSAIALAKEEALAKAGGQAPDPRDAGQVYPALRGTTDTSISVIIFL